MGPYVVGIDRLTPIGPEPPKYFLKRPKETLQKQGQIEPAIVSDKGEILGTHSNDFWYAAKDLGWPTFLVAVQIGIEEDYPEWLSEELRQSR